MIDYSRGNEPMRWPTLFLLGTVLLFGLAAAPVRGEQVTYYMWTDDEGVIHAEDTPPVDHDYETRTIEVPTSTSPAPSGDAGAGGGAPSPGTEAGGGNAPTAGAPSEGPTTDAQRAVADEEQRRLEQEPGFNSGGAETAPGAETSSPGSTASGAEAATGGAGAQGAATAPGAAIPPPVIGP